VPTQILLPKLGFSMDDAHLGEWFAHDGAHVVEGQALYTLESEKAVQEIEAPATGTLKILAPEGAAYPIGHLLGEIR
jgi:pyruvate/2-oxoglutarate dehydrogenase complex dihydrolipoamide acyltransferase (E2) component